jgi:hypothetical protein
MMPSSSNAVSQPPSPEPPNPVPPNPIPGAAPAAPSRGIVWIHRADLFLSVMIHLYLGLFLFFVPWMQWWTQNFLFLHYAPLAHFTQNGAVRGMVSGLGLMNLWIALAEALHFKES